MKTSVILFDEKEAMKQQDKSDLERAIILLKKIEGFLYCSILNDDFEGSGEAYKEVKYLLESLGSVRDIGDL